MTSTLVTPEMGQQPMAMGVTWRLVFPRGRSGGIGGSSKQSVWRRVEDREAGPLAKPRPCRRATLLHQTQRATAAWGQGGHAPWPPESISMRNRGKQRATALWNRR